MPNNSMNPTSPANGGGAQPNAAPSNPATPDVPTAPPAQPRNIRDYIALARSQGQAPSFTNQDGGAGYDIRQDPNMIQQAIPEEPQSEYEQMPFAQRMKINPYIRAKQRMQTMMPELYQTMFPQGGSDNGELSKQEYEHYQGSVEAMTANLLKQYDKQYDWALKNEAKSKSKRVKDEDSWQKFYANLESQQRLPTDPDSGEVLTAREFIDKQMSIADERKFAQDMEKEVALEEEKPSFEDYGAEDIVEIIRNNPDLGAALKERVMEAISEIVGTQISDNQYLAIYQDAAWKEKFNELTRNAVMEMQDEIMKFANSKPKESTQESAIPENPMAPEPSSDMGLGGA
jgi:hypothetical protein